MQPPRTASPLCFHYLRSLQSLAAFLNSHCELCGYLLRKFFLAHISQYHILLFQIKNAALFSRSNCQKSEDNKHKEILAPLSGTLKKPGARVQEGTIFFSGGLRTKESFMNQDWACLGSLRLRWLMEQDGSEPEMIRWNLPSDSYYRKNHYIAGVL